MCQQHSTVLFHLVLFYVVGLVYTENVPLQRYVFRRDDHMIKDERRLGQEINTSSFIACIAYCDTTDLCKTLPFNVKDRRCRLAKNDVSVLSKHARNMYYLKEETG